MNAFGVQLNDNVTLTTYAMQTVTFIWLRSLNALTSSLNLVHLTTPVS
jgi:hypothetical protein